MAHLQFLPGDPHLVDQLVYELKSKGIFDKFRKECIADVDTRPAYQNLRQRVESSVASFLSRQCWKPDLNKNQLREKLRKHLLDGNYLEQGVERIVDQVVNPKVASVFIPQVEDVFYNYLGIPRQKSTVVAETSNGKGEDLLPTDLEAVSPGSVKSNDDKNEEMDTSEPNEETKVEDDEKPKAEIKEDSVIEIIDDKKMEESRMSGISELTQDSVISIDKNTTTIPLPAEEIKLENIPAPENSPPKINEKNIDLEKIDLPKEPNLSTDIPLPDEMPKVEKDNYFKPIILQSEDDDSSSDASLRRNMSPLTPIRNFNNENSCDAQQAFENDSDSKSDDKKEPSTFRFTIESKSSENSSDGVKPEKKDPEQLLSYQFENQVNINTFNTPVYEDSSNSNNLQIDYESDVNSKATVDTKVPEPDQNSGDSKKEKKLEEKKTSHKSSHRSRDSHRHSSSSKDKRSDSKHSNSRDSSRLDKKSSKDEHKSKSSSHKEKSSDRSEKKDSRDSSKHRSSHKSSGHKDSKHRSSSSSKHSSSKNDIKKSSSSSSHKDKERSSDKSKDKSKDSKPSSHRSDKDKDRKSSSKSKHDEKENKDKKEKKETDDHYSLSGRGNPNRRSTDRDSNDGSSSSKGSHHPSSSKSTESKKGNKSSSKSDNTSTSGDSTSPSDKDGVVMETNQAKNMSQTKPIVRVDTHLEVPISTPPRLPFVPDVTLKKPRFAANLEEAKRMIKMRKFLEEEQKRMNQEAALLLEFQANVRPSLSQVYSSISGPELEFACEANAVQPMQTQVVVLEDNSVINETVTKSIDDTTISIVKESEETVVINSEPAVTEEVKNNEEQVATVEQKDLIAESLIAMHLQNDCGIDENVTEEQDIIDNIKIITQTLPKTEPEHIDQSSDDIIQTLSNNDGNETDNTMDSQCNDNIETIVVDPQDSLDNDENSKHNEYFEVTIITEALSESENEDTTFINKKKEDVFKHPEEDLLQYFAEHEKYNAELKRAKYSRFLKSYTKKANTKKMYLINCDTYEENLIREASECHGKFEIVNYHKNGHVKVPKTIVKNVNVTTEFTLPTKPIDDKANSTFNSPMFSPVKSDCSFELSSEYDAKLEEMVNKTSRREIMEIILGNVIDGSPSKMPKIDYCMDSNIDIETEKPKVDFKMDSLKEIETDKPKTEYDTECNMESETEESKIESNMDSSVETETHNCLKRKLTDVESTVNNNRHILTSNKIRKLSGSDQISSTTEDAEESSNNNRIQTSSRSKFLGKARRVGLPKPKRPTLPNSPSSDKSVENYSQNCTTTPNGRAKPRNKVQRYDTSDLYKPKLHYLSRRNNVT